MKNILQNILLLVIPALLMPGLQSCYNNLEDTDTVEVCFITSFPTETRSFGKGEQINTLVVGVLDTQKEEIKRLEFEIDGNVADVKLSLVKNHTYSFVFWAYDSNLNIYDLDDLTAIRMKALPEAVTFQMAEAADAFFAAEENVTINGNNRRYIELLRPLAQINIGTTGAPIQASFKTYGAPDTFYPFSNTVSGTKDFIWNFSETTTKKFSVEDNEYNYLTMGYVFAPSTATDISVELTLSEGESSKTVEFPQVTIEANCKSNIAGKFTHQTEL